MYKKILVIVLAAMFLVPAVTAAEEAGVVPGSVLYVLDLAWEKFEILMAREPLKKADVYIEQANERLAELGSISDSGEREYQDLTLDRYKARLYNSKLEIDKASSLEQDTSEITQKLKDTIQENKPILDNIVSGVKLEVEEELARAELEAEGKVKELEPLDFLSDAAKKKLEEAEEAMAEEVPEPEVIKVEIPEEETPEETAETVEETFEEPAEPEETEETPEEENTEETFEEPAEPEETEETHTQTQVPRTGSGWH